MKKCAILVWLTIVCCVAFASGKGATSTSMHQSSACLPPYQPRQVAPQKNAGYILPDGSIRVVGLDDMKGIIIRLDALFTRTHPGIRFTFVKSNSLAAIYSLMFGTSAFAPVAISYPNSLTYRDIVHGSPFSIRVAHGSLSPNAELSPLGVIVNKSNPIENLTMNQLFSIFSQQMRRPVLSHWDQVGLTGGIGNSEIHPYGLPWSDHYPSEDTGFGDYVFFHKMGGAPPVENYSMVGTYAEVVRHVSSDPSSIGITSLNSVNADVKVLGIVNGEFNGPMHGTVAEIRSGKYPLDRCLRIYGRLVSGQPFDPLVKEYMRMVLSREGQQIIADDPHGYIPLNPLEVQEELAAFQ